MADVDTSSYPKPQAAQNPLDQIVKFGQVADTLGNVEAGKAVQGAIQEDGSIDRNMLAQALKGSVAGSMKALPTLDALEKLRSAGYGADQAALETFQKRMAITHHLFSGLASKANPTINDVYDVAAKVMDPGLEAKKYGITLPVVMGSIKQFFGPDGKPLGPKQIKQKALEIQTQAAATSDILHQHSPQVRLVETGQGVQFQPGGTASNPAYTETGKALPPSTEVTDTRRVVDGKPNPNFGGKMLLGEQPQPQMMERVTGSRNEGTTNAVTGRPVQSREAVAANTPRGPATGLPVAAAESAKAEAEQAVAGANSLSTASNEVPATKAILNNLEEDLNKFTSGQGADWSRIAKNFANRNLPVPETWKKEGALFDEKSLASQEGFNKLAQQLAQVQFQALGGTGTDAKLNSAMSTSPNEYLSSLGNKGIIRLLKGNQDALAAKSKAWRAWRKAGNGPETFNEFSQDFNDHFDPRVFQFKYIPGKERETYVSRMDKEDQDKFWGDLTYARKAGWVSF